MAVVKNKEGHQFNSPVKEFMANEGDILPDNTNHLQGFIQNGSQIMILMDNDTIVCKIFNEKNNRWITI